jgi:hypothetical protein
MGRIYFDGPDPLAEDMAAIREGLQQSYAATVVDQQAAHDFFVASGDAVVGGHADVRKAGAQGDPDVGPPDAADY